MVIKEKTYFLFLFVQMHVGVASPYCLEALSKICGRYLHHYVSLLVHLSPLLILLCVCLVL